MLAEDVFGYRGARHGVSPANIKRKMGDDLRQLRWLNAVVERHFKVKFEPIV